jgi:hypothetical protein
MPRMGTMAGAGGPFSADDTGSLMDASRKAVSDIGAAVTLREMLSGLGAAGGKSSSADSSILGGVGQLVGGLGTAFKGMSETQQALFSSLMPKQNGQGGDNNQMLMFMLLMQVMRDASESKESALAQVLQTINSSWEARYRDLEQRSGPSQADQATHQITTQLLAGALQDLRKPPADPVELLVNAKERLQKLGMGGGGLLGLGGETQYTEGYLRNKELDIQVQKAIAEYSAQGESRKATTELTKAIMEGGPQLVQSLVVGTLQTLAALGYLPGVQTGGGAATGAAGAPQADAASAVAEAEAALARAGGAGGGA